jgi:3-keto-disaccharide hydrolase
VPPTDTPVPPTETPVPPTPEPGTEEFVQKTGGRWEPLVAGPDLPGWMTKGQVGWKLDGDTLRLEKGAGNLILVTEKTYQDAALSVRARVPGSDGAFGLVLRAQSGGRAIKVEFRQGKGILRVLDKSQEFAFDWPAGEWRHLAVVARGKEVGFYAERRPVASVPDAALETPGRLGVYCLAGAVELQELQVQTLGP